MRHDSEYRDKLVKVNQRVDWFGESARTVLLFAVLPFTPKLIELSSRCRLTETQSSFFTSVATIIHQQVSTLLPALSQRPSTKRSSCRAVTFPDPAQNVPKQRFSPENLISRSVIQFDGPKVSAPRRILRQIEKKESVANVRAKVGGFPMTGGPRDECAR